jgi:hypothetical protein
LGVEALWRLQTRMIESYIVESLAAQIQEFSMADFSRMLLAREGQLDGDVFDCYANKDVAYGYPN